MSAGYWHMYVVVHGSCAARNCARKAAGYQTPQKCVVSKEATYSTQLCTGAHLSSLASPELSSTGLQWLGIDSCNTVLAVGSKGTRISTGYPGAVNWCLAQDCSSSMSACRDTRDLVCQPACLDNTALSSVHSLALKMG